MPHHFSAADAAVAEIQLPQLNVKGLQGRHGILAAHTARGPRSLSQKTVREILHDEYPGAY